jgi:hypothetical protein
MQWESNVCVYDCEDGWGSINGKSNFQIRDVM